MKAQTAPTARVTLLRGERQLQNTPVSTADVTHAQH